MLICHPSSPREESSYGFMKTMNHESQTWEMNADRDVYFTVGSRAARTHEILTASVPHAKMGGRKQEGHSKVKAKTHVPHTSKVTTKGL